MGIFATKENIIELLKPLRNSGKKIVVTNGCFDILHVGHTRYLEASKSKGDILVVLLNSDVSVKKIKGENRPINSELDRAEILCALNSVDFTLLFDEESPVELIKYIKPDVYTKGADYTLETLPEAPELLPLGIKIEFIDFVQGKSTTNVINKMKN